MFRTNLESYIQSDLKLFSLLQPCVSPQVPFRLFDLTMSTERVYFPGESDSPITSVTGGAVKYDDIKATYNKDNLFEDRDFPPNEKSLGRIGGDEAAASGKAADVYKWLRPFEITAQANMPAPRFAATLDKLHSTELCSQYDVNQGGLGDCWYLVALAALAKRQDQLKYVIPEDNFTGFDDDKYCGAFHFRFYSVRHGKWFDIAIDDYLPCSNNGAGWYPAFTQVFSGNVVSSEVQTEFWPAFVEKAYAKFIGTYELIEGGQPCEGLEDFTAGFGEKLSLSTKPVGQDALSYEDVKKVLKKVIAHDNFCGLTTYTAGLAAAEGCVEGYTNYAADGKYGYVLNRATNSLQMTSQVQGLGICPQHAYTILDAQEVRTKDGSETKFLVKIRNPHATHEWSGTFSDADDGSWSRMEKDLRLRDSSGSANIDEGEFWMELADVQRYFMELQVCYFSLTDGTQCAQANGVWPAALQAQSLSISPQNFKHFTAFKFTIKKALDSCVMPAGSEGKCIAAFQVAPWAKASPNGPLFIYFIYKVEESDLANLQNVYSYRNPTVQTNASLNAREINKWGLYDPGTYILVPVIQTSVEPQIGKVPIPDEFYNKDIPFTVRVFSENETTVEVVAPQASQTTTEKTPTEKYQDLLASLQADPNSLDAIDLGAWSF